MKGYRSTVLMIYFAFSIGFAALLTSCGSGDKKQDDPIAVKEDTITLFSVNGELFSIPSPVQTSLLLKQSGAGYSKELLNPTKNLPSYSVAFKKAANLGVFGADLGYVIIYGQTQDALGYLNASKKLADDIGVSGAFNDALLKRFEKNMGNNDSLLSIFTSAYRATDQYLKNNDRREVSGLIIAGGWIETMYFTTHILKNKFANRQQVINRVGEQKTTLDHVIKLLTPYYQNPDKPEYTELTDQLIELYHLFEDIEVKYTYAPSTTDVANKITTINSTTEVNINELQLNTITERVAEIRNQIIN